MPFIEKSRRAGALTQLYSDPGDICYRQYRAFMDMWKKEPRWRTIDEYAKRIWEDNEHRAAALALLVFMHKHGFKYEDVKEKENGGID